MSAISGLDVTVGSALGPAHYKRWVNSAGVGTPLTTGPQQTFLWVKSSSEEPPITALSVLYDDEPTPEGHKKLNRDVTGSGGRVYLSYSSNPAARALSAVSVLLDGEAVGAYVHIRERGKIGRGGGG
jgi:hypothetical protein